MSALDRNRLNEASSPYLRQHRDNPVHWMEWNGEALARARRENKPILLSIGYAACHWCHVMAHESFEDEETAALMNQLYINIKVDREERPEIDQIYMEALHGMGQQGGWPLTMFLTPEGKAYWGGTYFPRQARQGMPAFRAVLVAVERAWREQWETVSENAVVLEDAIRKSLTATGPSVTFTSEDADQFASESFSMTDKALGGLAQGPKFPNAPVWEALWTSSFTHPQAKELREQAVLWLKSLCLGGIYDHLGGGIHRYAVDSNWLVPHFEKMLYDNALFLRTLSLAHHGTVDAENRNMFRNRIEETIGFLQRNMLVENAGLVSSYDADSEGEEGRYYVWSEAEIDRHLPFPEAALFKSVYGVTPQGNWEGHSIFHRLHPAGAIRIGEEESQLQESRARLLTVRDGRMAPSRDDKILTDWNGLAIRAIADCAFRLSRTDWMAFARQIFHSVSESVNESGRLPHSRLGAQRKFPALLTDLAAMVNAALTLHAYTGEETYAAKARIWLGHAMAHHQDGEGGYYLTASDAPDLPFRAFQDRDEATPSASGQWLDALQRAALVFSDSGLQEKTDRLAARLWGRVRQNPHGHAGIINALALHLEPAKLILSKADGPLAAIARAYPDPHRIDMPGEGHASRFSPQKERPAAWLCNGPVCLPPIFDAASLEAILAPEESG